MVKPFPLQTKKQRPGEIKLQPMNSVTSLGFSGYWSPWKWDCFVDKISVNPITSLGTSQRCR